MSLYYEDSQVKLFHGDCRELAYGLGRFDLLLTDPPYGIKVDSTMAAKSGEQYGRAAAPKGKYAATNWDAAPPDAKALGMLISMAEHAIIWGGNYFALPPARCFLVWDKENGDNKFADAELAWTNLDKPVRLKRHLWNGMLRKGREVRFDHPTQKPLDLMLWCIHQAGLFTSTTEAFLKKPEGTVFDPYAGSGTTLRAAKDLGLKAVGIEIEEAHCETAAIRLAQESLSFAE